VYFSQDSIVSPTIDLAGRHLSSLDPTSAVASRISLRLTARLWQGCWGPVRWLTSLAARIRATGWSRPLRRWVLHHRAARAAVAVLLATVAVPVFADEGVSSSAPVTTAAPAASDPIAWDPFGLQWVAGTEVFPGVPSLFPDSNGNPGGAVLPSPPAGTVPVPSPPGTPPEKPEDRQAWFDRWLGGIQVVGQKTLNYRWLDVSGSDAARRAFQNTSPNYGSLTHLSVIGHFLDNFEVNMTLTDGKYGADPQQMALKYHNGGTRITAGDVAASLTGNALIPFNRTLRAIMVEQQLNKRTSITGLVSETRAVTRRVDVVGNNTVGPYYLNAFPIVVDSVRVRVDEQDVPRENFMVDAYAGTVTFKPGFIVPQTSTIHVSFEARTEGAAMGTLWGLRANHALGQRGSIGATLLLAGAGNSPNASADGERTDDWYEGHADSNGPYQLRYGPVIRGSEQVYVGGVLQQANHDYYIQYDRGVIQFTRILLSTEHLRVVYRPVLDGQLQDTITGEGIAGPYRLSRSPIILNSETVVRVDRLNQSAPLVRDVDYRLDAATGVISLLRASLATDEAIVVLYRPQQTTAPTSANRIIGFDGNLALGRNSRLSAQFAQSSADGGVSGTGMTVEARTGFLPAKFNGGNPRLRLGATWKRIDPGFTGIDSVSFLRNERGLGLDGEFLVNSYTRLFSKWERSRRPLGFGAVQGSDTLYDTTQSLSGFTIARPKWPELTYSRTRLEAESSGSNSAQGSDAVQLRYALGHMTLGAEYLDNSSRGAFNAVGLVAAGTSDAGLTTSQTTKFFASYAPGQRLSLAATVANSDIANNGESTRAKNVDLNATFRPARPFQVTADYQVSDSGGALTGPLTGTSSSLAGSTGIDLGVRGLSVLPESGGISIGSPSATLGGLPAGFGTAGGVSASALGSYGGFGSSYYGGNTTRGRLGFAYTPTSRMSLNVSLDRTNSELYGDTNGYAFGFMFAPGERLSFNGTLSRQRAGFVNPDQPAVTASSMTSDLLFLSLRARPYGKLMLNLEFQEMHANNTSGLASGLAGTGSSLLTSTAFANDIRSMTGRVSYPIGTGRTAFLELRNARYGGSELAARQNSLAAGVEFSLNRILAVTLGAELHDYRDAQRPDSNYRARLLNANLAARF
jgi:hypothetical protein